MIPNPWDVGSARILASLGFSGARDDERRLREPLGRLDGSVTREEALEHARRMAAATPLPVAPTSRTGSATHPRSWPIRSRSRAGQGSRLLDRRLRAERGLYPAGLAVDRVRAAVEARRKDSSPLVITARCENFFRGNPDLAATIARLQAYQEAGADMLFAPGIRSAEDVRSIVAEIERPLNVLILPGGPTVRELFAAGATRVSTGSALAAVAQDALIEAARELQDPGSHEFWSARSDGCAT